MQDFTSWVCKACETPDVRRECCLCPVKGLFFGHPAVNLSFSILGLSQLQIDCFCIKWFITSFSLLFVQKLFAMH